MKRFDYFVASSVLHDKKAVESIFEEFDEFLRSIGGKRRELQNFDSLETNSLATVERALESVPLAFFILTGGTEGIVLPILERYEFSVKSRPVVLFAHTKQNSLPAALEILAKVRQEGGEGIIHLIESAHDEHAKKEIEETMIVLSSMSSMEKARIGVIGAPSDWLVASNQSPEIVRQSWGPEMVSIPIDTLRETMDRIRAMDGVNIAEEDEADKIPAVLTKEARNFLSEAIFNRGPTMRDMYKSDTIFRALDNIVTTYALDALTLRCFDLVELDASTGCFALSQLADNGIDAGCEGDIPSILAIHWMRLLSGESAWMANPSRMGVDEESSRGEILLAHCTVPRRGLEGYGIRTHFESGLGVGIAGEFRKGDVTLARIGGESLEKVWIAEGELLESPHEEGLCRTQAVIRLDGESIGKLLGAPLGNHIVVVRGHHEKIIRKYMRLSGKEF
jgi:L-fucose isomerase-like protein